MNVTYCVEHWGHAGENFTLTMFSAEQNSKNYNFFCLLGPYCSNFSETEKRKIGFQRTSVFMYKLMTNMLPIAMNSLVVRNNDIYHYNTRQNHLRGSPFTSHMQNSCK